MSNRLNPSLANLDDKYVFILGVTERIKRTTDYYNIYQDSWTEGPEMTVPRYDFSSCILVGILYAFNGTTQNNDCIESLDA